MDSKALVPIPLAEIRQMADAAAKSGLMPSIRTPEAALTLMMLCQAEGLHPIQALRRYHIIEGRPSMRSDAMLSDFQRMGGVVEWIKTTAEECEAVFTAPGVAKPVTVRWAKEDAVRAGLWGRATWGKFPAQMLRARTVSDGVRMTMPGVVAGIYTPEEVQDFDKPCSDCDGTGRRAGAVCDYCDGTGVYRSERKPTYTPPPKTEKEPETFTELAAKVINEPSPVAIDQSSTIDPVTVKRVVVAVTKLRLGEDNADKLGLKGKGRDEVIRPIRLNWIGEVIGRKVGSTKDLTTDEAAKVLFAADQMLQRKQDKAVPAPEAESDGGAA